MTARIRYIDTADLPAGFDVGDLIAQGVTGKPLLEWMKARVRDGLPPAEPRPEPVRAPPTEPAERPQKSPGIVDSDTGAGRARTGESRRAVNIPQAPPPSTPAPVRDGNVVTLPQPDLPPEADPDLPPEFSDDALADRFADRYGEVMAYVPTWGRWMQWNNALWEHDEKLRSLHLARRICREASAEVLVRPDLAAKARTIATALASARTMGNVERVARSDPRIVAGTSQWDADEWVLNTPAGIIDLRTGSIRAARRSDYVTKVTAIAPGGPCPHWLQFLRTATDGDEPMIEFLRRVAGYCLTGSTREHALFFAYGTGGNGKGTFLNTLEWILNSYARVASTELFLEQRFANDRADIAGLMGARMVLAQEVQEGKKWNEARLKEFTGGDTITAKFLYANPFEYKPQFKLMFSGNHKPQLRNVDEAIKRRFHMLPFTVTVPPEKRDRNLSAKLRDEAGGILQWAIDGCLDWQDNMLAPPPRVLDATEDYFQDEDTIGQFLTECCDFDRSTRVRTTELYKRYGRWCESNGEFTLPRRRWLQQLATKSIESRQVAGEMVIEGIGLKYEVRAYGRREDDTAGF